MLEVGSIIQTCRHEQNTLTQLFILIVGNGAGVKRRDVDGLGGDVVGRGDVVCLGSNSVESDVNGLDKDYIRSGEMEGHSGDFFGGGEVEQTTVKNK